MGTGLLWLLFGEAMAGTCAQPVPTEDLNKMIAAADAAFLASQSESVPPIAASLNEALPCASGLLNPVTVGGVYRVNAVSAFVARDREASKRWFAALRTADPGYALPSMIGEKHPLRVDFLAIDLSAQTGLDLAPASTGRLWVNGNPAEKRPEALPALVQWEDSKGRVGWTALLQPGDALPEYPTGKAVAGGDPTGETPTDGGEKHGFTWRLFRGKDDPTGTEEPLPDAPPSDGQPPEAIVADGDGQPVMDEPKHEGPRWVFVAGGGAALVAAGGLGLWSMSEGAAYDDCASGDPGCFERWSAAWEADAKGNPDLTGPARVGGIMAYGLNETYARNHLAAQLALGAGVLGAGLITVGFVW